MKNPKTQVSGPAGFKEPVWSTTPSKFAMASCSRGDGSCGTMSSSALTFSSKQADLLDQIALREVECLNEAPAHPWVRVVLWCAVLCCVVSCFCYVFCFGLFSLTPRFVLFCFVLFCFFFFFQFTNKYLLLDVFFRPTLSKKGTATMPSWCANLTQTNSFS